MALHAMCPSFPCASDIDIFDIAVFAVLVFDVRFVATTLYRLSLLGMVAMVLLFGFLMVHIPLLNVTENPALSSLLMDMRVNAILGA